MKKNPTSAVSAEKPSGRGQVFLSIGDTTTKTGRLTEEPSPHGMSETEREQASRILGEFLLANPGVEGVDLEAVCPHSSSFVFLEVSFVLR